MPWDKTEAAMGEYSTLRRASAFSCNTLHCHQLQVVNCRTSSFSLAGIELQIPSEWAKRRELLNRKAWEPSGGVKTEREKGRTCGKLSADPGDHRLKWIGPDRGEGDFQIVDHTKRQNSRFCRQTDQVIAIGNNTCVGGQRERAHPSNKAIASHCYTKGSGERVLNTYHTTTCH